MKYASIVPLIGGETLGMQAAFGKRPEYILSYSPFVSNDSHLLKYYDNEVPYILLDKEHDESAISQVDVVNTVCPCAGLSMMHHHYGDDNENNKWMIETAEYVLGRMKPRVFWGENSPHFAGKVGKNVRQQMFDIGRKNGYTMTVYRTKSMLHGLCQVRERSFYFFWKDTKVPLMDYYYRPHKTIEDVIMSVKGNFQMEPINPKKPTDDPYYRFILDVIHPGLSHTEFSAQLQPQKARGNDVLGYIELMGYDYKQVGEWMGKNGYEREVPKCERRYEKLKAGGSIMRRSTVVPKDYIGAFVGHYPYSLTHPVENRYITARESMAIMGMPEDMELIDPQKNSNHVCQNVPVQTATDMATEVKKYLEGSLPMIDGELVFQSNHNRTHEVVIGEKNSNLNALFGV